MTTASTSPISKLLESLDPIVTMERDGLVVIALGSSLTGAAPTYLTLDEALAAQAVGIHEVGEGSVPTVAVERRSGRSSSSAATRSWAASRTAS
jgi:hypothetical protein